MVQTQVMTRRAQVHLVEEATQDTYTAPAGDGTGMFLAYISDEPMTSESTNWSPEYARPDHLVMDEVAGTISATLNFRVPVKGSGSAGTAPEFAEALKACGLEQTTDATGGTDQYTVTSSFDGVGGNPGPSYSVSILEDGIRYAIAGAFGTAVLNATIGEPAFIDFTFTGQYQAVAADALETGGNLPSYNTTSPPAFMGASLSINIGGAYTPVGVETLSFDLGNNVVVGRDVNETTGVYGARIVPPRRPILSFDPEYAYDPTGGIAFNWDSLQRAGTAGTFTTGAIGGTAGNKWTLAINRLVLRPITRTARNNIRVLGVTAAVSSQATDVEGTTDPWTLTFT